MVYTIEMAAAQIEIHMNGIRSNSRTGSLLCQGGLNWITTLPRGLNWFTTLSGGFELDHYSVRGVRTGSLLVRGV